jgi:MurNAc alpha-1-phosphate uridylyltransferase
MRPLTNTLPKPLIPVAGKPLIDWCLDWLYAGGITQVVVNSSYRADQLEAHVAGCAHPRVVLSREEPEPLETGGGIVKALPLLGDAPFLAMNSDAIIPRLNSHPIDMLVSHWSAELDFLMLVVAKDRAIGWSGQGDFILDETGRLRRPQAGEDAPYVFTGIELIHPRVFDHAPAGKFSLSTLWDTRKGADGWYQRMRAIPLQGDWLNVGDLQGLEAAEAYFR